MKILNNGKISILNHTLKRRAAKNNIIELFTIEQFMNKIKQHNNICPYCSHPFDNSIHKASLDHIFPISKANEEFKLTGIKRTYTINDIQPLCLSCNSSKRDKLPNPKDLNTRQNYKKYESTALSSV